MKPTLPLLFLLTILSCSSVDEKQTESVHESSQTLAQRLIGQWALPEGNEAIMAFEKDSLDVGFARYRYALNGDSIQIYTRDKNYEGGLIQQLNKDSLQILWDTGDINLYLRLNL